jgi:hypothetical protein
MAKKVLGSPYDPQIPPERQQSAAVNQMLESRRGTNGFMRMGETYILTCSCGELMTTVDYDKGIAFDDKHKSHK